jgi:pantoate--beta-alanine ligase
MGAIHDGHLALVRAARKKTQRVVATIFVNPTQFGPVEDLARYPRDEANDVARFEIAGCHLVYAPPVEEIYPDGPKATVSPGPLGDVLEGKFRPGHFAGVATVVSRLFEHVGPDLAAFGEKDYQQLLVIKQLGTRVEILPVPTVRETDGLALSSRNVYLSLDERRIAPALHSTIAGMAGRLVTGANAGDEIARGAGELRKAGFKKIDYLAVCDAETLAPIEHVVAPARVLVAAWLGSTRLIDNVPAVIPEPPPDA